MKKLIITFCIVLAVIVIAWLVYTQLTVKIALDINNINVAAVQVRSPGGNLYTKDGNKIQEVIKHLNSIKYYKKNGLEIYNTTPDADIAFYDKDGNIIDKIYFYGYVTVHKDNRYGMMPFTYSSLEKLCNKLNGE